MRNVWKGRSILIRYGNKVRSNIWTLKVIIQLLSCSTLFSWNYGLKCFTGQLIQKVSSPCLTIYNWNILWEKNTSVYKLNLCENQNPFCKPKFWKVAKGLCFAVNIRSITQNEKILTWNPETYKDQEMEECKCFLSIFKDLGVVSIYI